MSRLEEKTIKTEKIFDGRVIRLQVEEVELPNGQMSKREVVKHPGAVAILALTDEGKIVMVEQYRKALEKTIIEIPAGKLEGNEDPLQCAKRELEEETGYGCDEMEWLISFYTSPGFADELVHLYIARGLHVIENAASLDEDEFVQLLEVSVQEAIDLIGEHKIHDAKTAYAVQYMQLKEALQKK